MNSRGKQTTFGKVPSYRSARLANVSTATPALAASPTVYAPPQSSNYADIVGNAFQGGNFHADLDSYGLIGYAKPVVGLRFVSALIDFILLCFVSVAIMFVYVAMNSATKQVDGSGTSGGMLLLLFVVWFGYGIVMEASGQQGTVGKILTNTVVVNKDGGKLSFGQVLGRNFGKVISGIVPFYIPYFMVVWTENKQSLHDKMCQSYVYKKSDLNKLGGSVFD